MSSKFYYSLPGEEGGIRAKTTGLYIKEAIFNCIHETLGNRSWINSTGEDRRVITEYIYGTCQDDPSKKEVLHCGFCQLTFINRSEVPLDLGTTVTPDNPDTDDEWQIGERRIFLITLEVGSQIVRFEFIGEGGSILQLQFLPVSSNAVASPSKEFKVLIHCVNGEVFVFSNSHHSKVFSFSNHIYEYHKLQVLKLQISRSGVPVFLSDEPSDFCTIHNVMDASSGRSRSFLDDSPRNGNDENQVPPSTLTAHRLLDIIRRFFQRKEDRRVGKIQKADISGPTDFRHIQHVGMDRVKDGTNNLTLNIGDEKNGVKEKEVQVDSQSANPDTSNANVGSRSPDSDAETMRFIYNVVEECRNSSPDPASGATFLSPGQIRHEKGHNRNRRTVHFPIMTQAELSSIIDAATATVKSGASHGANPHLSGITDRDRLINELRLLLQQDDEAAELIVNFVEEFKKERALKSEPASPAIIESPPTLNHSAGQESESEATQASLVTPRSPRWSSGRTAAPPPPRPVTAMPAFSLNPSSDDMPGPRNGASPRNEFAGVRNSLRAELSHNLSNRNNNNNGDRFSTLPHVKNSGGRDSSSKHSIKKTNSERRPSRRPNEPPPPPIHFGKDKGSEAEVSRYLESVGHSDDDDIGDKANERESPRSTSVAEPELETRLNRNESNDGVIQFAKPFVKVPPIPKPRTIAKPRPAVRRLNSTPISSVSADFASDLSRAITNSSKSFDEESGTGNRFSDRDGEDEEPPSQPPPTPPPTPQHSYLAELKEKIKRDVKLGDEEEDSSNDNE